ncbi:MAG: hypothetical protein R2813_06300 [Flavobacteriales bacterium]
MSLQINISNYEAYVMDYLEGSLTPDERAAFAAFMLANPELALEIEEMAEVGIDLQSEVNSSNFESIKLQVKPVLGVDEHNYEEAFALAGKAELQKLKAFVADNPFLANDFKLYQAAQLAPTSQKFENKSALKKPIPLWEQVPFFAVRIAAAVALILGLASVWRLMDDSVYNPRNAGVEFAEMEDLTASNAIAQLGEITEKKVDSGVQLPRVKEVRREMIALMPVAQVVQKALTPTIEYRNDEWIAHIEPEEVTVAHHSASELSVAQFIGKQFLGVDPTEAPTTKDVLKQSAKKVIANNDQVALNTSVGDDNKKTVEVLAGLFEYRRVTYAVN